MKNVVVLLHALALSKNWMWAIQQTLKKDGYTVININYPSRKKSITDIGLFIAPQLQPWINNAEVTLHFVTHSMGGLIARHLIDKYSIKNIGKVIMLGPPNQGSALADRFKNFFLFKFYFGPAAQELTESRAREKQFPLIAADVGIIAGDRTFDPLCYFLLSRPNDGKVTVENTKLAGMKDHIVIHTTHTFMVFNKKVINQIRFFLKHGYFSKKL